jgi:hypothetical protein
MLTEIDNVLNVEIKQIGEGITTAWRSIIIRTEQGEFEIVLGAKDPDNLKIAL